MSQQEVFNLLDKKRGEFMSATKIAKALHIGESSVLCSLRKLLRRGDIKRIVKPKQWVGEHTKSYFGVPTGQISTTFIKSKAKKRKYAQSDP